MIINFLLIAVLICSSAAGFAQERKWDQQFVDSILPRLENIKADSNGVDQIKKLADMYFSVNPDSSILLADRGDSMAESIHYYEAQIYCLAGSALANVMQSNWAAATMKMNKALPICQQHEPQLLLLVYNLMFAISGIKGEFGQAIHWKNMQLGLLNNYTGPDWIKWPAYMQMTIVYTNTDQMDSARCYADSLKVYINKYANHNLSSGLKRDSYMALGTLALKEGNKDLALQYFRTGSFLMGIARFHQESGTRDSAIFYAKQDLQIWTKRKSPLSVLEPADMLAKLYESIDPAESNKYLRIYIKALSDFYSTDKQLAQVRLNQERLVNELQSKDLENRNKISMIVAASIVILLCGFSFLLWRNNRFKQKANLQLEASYKELKSTQAQLIQSEKMASLGELTAGIAHEIQNPLNFVNNFSELNTELIGEIRKEINAGNYPEVKNLANDLEGNMEKIALHGKRADAIVKSMLQHSRPSSGEKEPTDINSLADEYLKLSYHGVRAKDKSFNSALHTGFDESIGNINVISQDIARVLLNIYNNAFHAVAERKRNHPDGYNPEVTVSTRKTGDLVEIRISDNGIGIPEKLLQKIFQPFFTTKPSGEGTGLGLSLSYDVVKAHGGELKVNTKEGEGTVFTIQLPV
jgi:two-component system NtrC family sensor kinase